MYNPTNVIASTSDKADSKTSTDSKSLSSSAITVDPILQPIHQRIISGHLVGNVLSVIHNGTILRGVHLELLENLRLAMPTLNPTSSSPTASSGFDSSLLPA